MTVNDDLESIWKGTFMAYFKKLPINSKREAEENYKMNQSSGPRFELSAICIRGRILGHLTTTLGHMASTGLKTF